MDDAELYGMLARSIAPEIYGLEDVKKALLLQMAGGLTVTTHDHLRIRGEKMPKPFKINKENTTSVKHGMVW